jgi:hypothetical protein
MITSVIIAYGIWAMVHNHRYHTVTRTIPVTFYNLDDKTVCDAPEYINVCLQSSWQQLRSIDYDQLAAHMDANTYIHRHALDIDEENLLLPKSIKLVSYKPANNYITIQA